VCRGPICRATWRRANSRSRKQLRPSSVRNAGGKSCGLRVAYQRAASFGASANAFVEILKRQDLSPAASEDATRASAHGTVFARPASNRSSRRRISERPGLSASLSIPLRALDEFAREVARSSGGAEVPRQELLSVHTVMLARRRRNRQGMSNRNGAPKGLRQRDVFPMK